MLQQFAPEHVESVRRKLETVRVILAEEHTARKLSFITNPRSDTTFKHMLAVENEIVAEFCNAPHVCYCDINERHFQLGCL